MEDYGGKGFGDCAPEKEDVREMSMADGGRNNVRISEKKRLWFEARSLEHMHFSSFVPVDVL